MELFYTSSRTVICTYYLEDKGISGDLIPKDGRYSTEVNSEEFNNFVGSMFFHFTATDIDSTVFSSPLDYPLTIVDGEKNLPPSIRNINLPDSINIEENPELIVEIEVSDPQGNDDIKVATCMIYFPLSPVADKIFHLNDEGINGDKLKGDGIFTCRIKTNEISFYGEGVYTFLFKVEDSSGNKSPFVWKNVYFYSESGNFPPSVTIVSVPDSIKAKNDTILFEVKVSDPNGLSDIAKVYFNSYKPDGSPSSANPVYMLDDGGKTPGFNSGDKKEKDGIYSKLIIITPEVSKGNYRFEFFAVDNEGLISPEKKHIIVVY